MDLVEVEYFWVTSSTNVHVDNARRSDAALDDDGGGGGVATLADFGGSRDVVDQMTRICDSVFRAADTRRETFCSRHPRSSFGVVTHTGRLQAGVTTPPSSGDPSST